MNGSADPKQWDIRLPEPNVPLQPSHLRPAPKWVTFMREMDADWRRFMQSHDRPEDRLATKVQDRFHIYP